MNLESFILKNKDVVQLKLGNRFYQAVTNRPKVECYYDIVQVQFGNVNIKMSQQFYKINAQI
jgi:hypothetical protein